MKYADLRPLTTGELLDRTFALYRNYFTLFVGITVLPHLFSLSVGLINVPLRRYLGLSVLGWTLLGSAVALVVAAIAQSATVVAVSDVYLSRPTSIIESYSKVKFSLFGVILLVLLVGMAVGLGAILLVIPGILLAVKWSLAVPVAVLEDEGIVDSMSRSAKLTEGYRWRVFAIWLLFFALSLSVALLLQWPIQLGATAAIRSHSLNTLPWLRAASTVLSFVSQCLVAPLATIAFSLLYYDLRVRKEGFDLQLMMDTIDGRQSYAADSGLRAELTGD